MHLSDNLADSFLSKSVKPDGLPIQRVIRRTAADEVRIQLIALIESGQLQVNGRLPSESELSRRFGVSRPIVREALGRLQALGLTESRPGSGTYVASNVTRLIVSVGQYSASDLNEIRRSLEVPAARLAAVRRTNSDLKELSRCLEQHERSTTAEEAVRNDSYFHCAVARATGNKLFLRLVDDLREILQEQSLAVSTLRNRGASAAREHRAVLEAIVAGDGDGAAAAMEEHLDAVERAIRELAPSRARTDGRQGATQRRHRAPSGGRTPSSDEAGDRPRGSATETSPKT